MPASHPNSDLFQLIRTMTPSEKRHFRLDNPPRKGKAGENQYLLLFEVLESQQEPDEVAAMKRLRIKERNRFNRIKTYLYKALLVSLENYYRESPGDAQFFHLVNQTQILLSKRLYQQAGRQLIKAEKLAQEKGNGIYMLIVQTLAMDRITREEHLDELEEMLDAYESMKAQSVERTRDYLDLQMIRSKATWLLRRGKDDNPKHQIWLEELGRHPLLQSLKYPEDTEFTLYYYNLNGLIHGLLGNPREDYRNRLAYLTTYQNNPAYIQRWPINYITALGNVAGSAAIMGNYEELLACTREMREFMDREGIKNRSSLDPIVEVRSYALELDAYPIQDAQDLDALNRNLERSFQNNEHDMTDVWQIIMRHGIARYYFRKRSWEKALEWINPVVHHSDERLYPELQCTSRILYTLANFELRNDRYLSTYLPKLSRWMNQHHCRFEPVKQLLREIKSQLHQHPRQFSAEQMAKMQKAFALDTDYGNGTAEQLRVREFLHLLNLEPWLSSKLQPVRQLRR